MVPFTIPPLDIYGSVRHDYHVIETTVLWTRPAGYTWQTMEVNKMELIGVGPDAHIYIGTESELFRIPVQSCSAHSTCCDCLASRDPYCAFPVTGQSCVARESIGAASQWIQDIQSGNTSLCTTVTTGSDASGTTDVATPKTCGGGVVVDNGNPTTDPPRTTNPPGPGGPVGECVCGVRESPFPPNCNENKKMRLIFYHWGSTW